MRFFPFNIFTRRKSPAPVAVQNHGNDRTTPFGTGNNGMQTNAAYMPLNRLETMLPFERRNALASSRFLDNNLALVGALNDSTVQFAIGDGIVSHAATDDPDYDDAADAFINQYFESVEFDITGEQTMAELTPVVVRAMVVDGDSGAANILMRDAKGMPIGDPQIQLFRSDQIGDGDGKNLFAGEKLLQGIARNSVGRATRYRVLKDASIVSPGSPAYWDYRPQDFSLIIDRKRIQQNRGMPWCHRATKNGFSMMDISTLVEMSEYVNALFAAIITTPDGETPEAFERFLVSKGSPTVTTEDANGTPKAKAFAQKFVEIFGGAKVPVFPQGTKLEAYQSNRNTAAFSGLMDYLAIMLGLSYGVPPSFVWPMALASAKPDTRKELSQASWYFNRVLVIAYRRFYKPKRDWLLQWGLLTGKLNNGKGPRNKADYRQAVFYGPRDVTIDERYFHKTWMDRLEAGQGTEQEYCALQSQYWKVIKRQRFKEVKYAMDLAEEMGVPYDRVHALKPGQQFTDPNADPALQEQQQQQLDNAA